MTKFIRIIVCVAWLPGLLSNPLIIPQKTFAQSQTPATDEPRFTPPPVEETSEIRTLIDKAQAALASRRAKPTNLLADPTYMPAHEWPRFRKMIRQHATNQTTMVTPQEPGEPMVVSGTIRNQLGRPIGGALIYVYQTSVKGWYSDKALHVSGNSGDQKYARLFGYLKTNQDGQYQFRTIRPAGYPRSTLPAHIHIEIEVPGTEPQNSISEIQFEDDPRFTKEMRDRALQERHFIFPVKRDPNGVQQVKADFRIE